MNASLGKALPASWWRDTDLNRRKRGREEGTELSQVVGGTSLFFTLALQKQGLAQGCLQAPPPQTLSPVSGGSVVCAALSLLAAKTSAWLLLSRGSLLCKTLQVNNAHGLPSLRFSILLLWVQHPAEWRDE